MGVALDRLGGMLLDASLSALLLWAVVALALLGSRQPARRLRLARAAVVGSLAIWPLVVSGVVPRLDVATSLHDVGVLPHPLLPAAWTPAPRLSADAASAPLAIGGPWAAWVVRALTLAYAAGVAVGLGWLALGWLVLAWVTGRAGDASPKALALYDELTAGPDGLRPGCRPRLRVAERVRRPALVGVFRLLILIPPELDRPEERDRLRLSLLHELAHAEAGDPWHNLLGNLARALWFFVPPLWWVVAQVRLDQEFLADRRAALGFGPPRAYASSLLAFATARAEAPALLGRGRDLVLGAGPGSPLFQRVLMLLQCPFPVEHRPPLWWSWGLPCLTVAVTLGVSSLSFRLPALTPAGPPKARSFLVSRLETGRTPPGPDGRAPAVELPVRLPDRFDLTLEVWGNPLTLARTRVAGLPLGIAPPDRPGTDESDRWHLVRLRRSRDGVRLELDGRALPLDPPTPTLTPSLSVEPPPDLPASFQRLTLSW